MPIHNWSKVDPSVFHDFHVSWIVTLSGTLNGGLLPGTHYATIEPHAAHLFVDVLEGNINYPVPNSETTYADLRRTIAVRQISNHRAIALIEMISPGSKDRESSVADFAEKAQAALQAGVHLLVIDLFPPTKHDPCGMHGAIWERFDSDDFIPSPDKPLMLAAYEADQLPEAYLEPFAVGDELSDMPLFLTRGGYINLPLEATYLAAFQSVPEYWRKVLEAAK